MEIITLILSGLALLAAIACLVLTIWEKKRSEKRNAALLRYIEKECKAVSTAAGVYADECDKKIYERIEKLEKGIVPDFEEARAAAEAVNDFNRGISNLLNFDPMEAIRAEREREKTGGEVK